MSRLTSSPFHRPSPFAFPREPISPPETLLPDSSYPTATANPILSNDQREDRNEVPIHADTTPSHSRPIRSSISYQNSGFRDIPNRPVHRSYRFFVVVIPPPLLINEHGQLGHTLSSGPSHRLSQGIIMPLFPTMYGQLTAIAKEFNFPSTAGLCLYLHVNEGGVVMTPRISDESWHMLWSHLFDMSSAPRGPPIGGRIEFDIDFQQARWYSPWLSTMSRDQTERSFSHPAPSIVIPSEPRDSINGELLRDSDQFESPPVPPPQRSHSRHNPRKLSLVDRFDSPLSRPESRSESRQTLGPLDHGALNPKALSPIAQEEEPHSAREQLDDRVKSWRARAVVKPSSLAGRGQTSLEPFNLPNNVSLDGDAPTSASIELNLDDFTWSISSVGPDDCDILSLGSPSERLPSPDLARRMLDDSPPTPSTATSWGPPLSYPPTPLSDFRPPSLDLAFRSVFSPPMTPATATSRRPLSPSSSLDFYQEEFHPRSIHLGERGEFSRPVTPSTATSWGAPLSYPPSPTTPRHVQTPDLAKRFFDLSQEHGLTTAGSSPKGQPWNFVWPYFEPVTRAVEDSSSGPWHLVWPYFNAQEAAPFNEAVAQTSRYPYLSIYPPVYPHFVIYPAAPAPVNWKIENSLPIKVTLDSHYPCLQIYPPVYPHNFVIYPEVQQPKEGHILVAGASSEYPLLNIYPAVYPYFDLYPTIAKPPSTSPAETTGLSYGVYPRLVVYPAVYPNLNIYPTKAAEVPASKIGSIRKQIKVALSTHYPNFNLYPAVYPNFDIYPVSSKHSRRKLTSPSPVFVSVSQYPVFHLYPAAYPNFNIYPPKAGSYTILATRNASEMTVVPKADAYPVIRPYPPVYPHFDLYPSKIPAVTSPRVRELAVLLPSASAYPTFEIYPAVYPHISLYLPVAGQVDTAQHDMAREESLSRHPYLYAHELVYPHLNIYPPIAVSVSAPPQPEVQPSISALTKPRVRLGGKSHHDLHQEVFQSSLIRTPSGTGMANRPEVRLRPLNVPPHYGHRRIATTRSPTGPALHRPATPPALPSPNRKLPTPPPPTNGVPRSPNVMEQMAEFRAEAYTARRLSPPVHTPSRSAVTATQRASMTSPLRQMPLPKSTGLWVHPDDPLITVSSSGLDRARSVGHVGRTPAVKPRVRDSFLVQRRYDL